MSLSERARHYLASMPPAVSGSGGDAATYRAAVALVKGFRLSADEALPLLREWNAGCLPPWSETELRAKLASADKSKRPPGWLLDSDRAQAPENPAQQKAASRRGWPEFRPPSAADIERLAARRHVSTEAAYLLVCHRHLWRCRWNEQECFAIHTGTFAQVRRMDGEPFRIPGHKPRKALNLQGSEGRFLFPGGLGSADVPVLLTEGAVSLLESTEAVLRADRILSTDHAVAVVAAVSAYSRFTPEDLAPLAGRRVRIIPDTDAAGQAGAFAWAASLTGAGCTVDCLHPPGGHKDLGESLQAVGKYDPVWTELLSF
jgi:hypothetical protein